MTQRKSVRSIKCSEKMWSLWGVYLMVILRFVIVFKSNPFSFGPLDQLIASSQAQLVMRGGDKKAITTELLRREDKNIQDDRGVIEK